jgi:hypothetical protein
MGSIDLSYYQLFDAIRQDAKSYDGPFSHYASIAGLVSLEENMCIEVEYDRVLLFRVFQYILEAISSPETK